MVMYQAIHLNRKKIDKGLFKSTLEPPLTATSLQRPLFSSRRAVHTFKIKGKADRTAMGR